MSWLSDLVAMLGFGPKPEAAPPAAPKPSPGPPRQPPRAQVAAPPAAATPVPTAPPPPGAARRGPPQAGFVPLSVPPRPTETKPVPRDNKPPTPVASTPRESKTEPPASPSAARPRRRFHLGLDWGTSATKMVLRDHGDRSLPRGAAYVLEEAGSHRHPTTVALADEGLWFGGEAEKRRESATRVWEHLKAATGVEHRWDEPAGIERSDLTLGDLAVLSLWHFAAFGTQKARRLATMREQEAVVAITVSVPEPHLEMPSSQRAYLRAAAIASRLARGSDPQGRSPSELLTAIRDAEPHVEAVLADMHNFDRYLRAEAVAAMVWPFFSPRTAAGPYTIIDVGAATTNASFFRIHHVRDPDGTVRWKGAVSIFGAETLQPGMNAYDERLAEAVRQPVTAVRTRQNHWHPSTKSGEMDTVVKDIRRPWEKARQYAWGRANDCKHWDGLAVIRIGGGAKVRHLRESFTELPGYFKGKLQGVQFLDDFGAPPDLHRLPANANQRPLRWTGDASFLLVAYGLSFASTEIFEANLPGSISQLSPVRSTRPFVTFEDLGYD